MPTTRSRRELERIRDGHGPGADQARTALTADALPTRLRAAILALVTARGKDSSICPSDAVRALVDDWRPQLPQTLEVAKGLARVGEVRLTQQDRVLNPDDEWHGPIRIRLPWSADG